MPTLYGEVSSIQGRSNVPAINRINILAAHILCYNKHAITFYAEENAFSILFYSQDDGNGRIFSETLNMDHSPRIEAEMRMMMTTTMMKKMMMRTLQKGFEECCIWDTTHT